MIFLSESGYPGLQDFQDVVVLLSMISTDFRMLDNKLSVKLFVDCWCNCIL
jgi:hypothetical protein